MPDTRLFPLPGGRRRNPQVDLWFDAQPNDLASVARRWFEEMRGSGPEVLDLLHDGHPAACVGGLAFGYVNVFKTHVNVGFFLGTSLVDPACLLVGTGRFMRHVKIQACGTVDERAVRNLVRAAHADMKLRLAPASFKPARQPRGTAPARCPQ